MCIIYLIFRLPPLGWGRCRRFVVPGIVVELVASVVAVAVVFITTARVVGLIHAEPPTGSSVVLTAMSMLRALVIVAGIGVVVVGVVAADADAAKIFAALIAAGLLLVSRLRSRLQPGHLIC